MNAMTREELISTFGEEAGNQMFDQMNPSAGGSSAPFSFIKKISDIDSELGAWGEFVVNVKTEKDGDGVRVITDKGDNLGKNFQFIIVNVGYHYDKWDAINERTLTSNSFTDLTSGVKNAVDKFTGKPLPANKEKRKEDGWKMVKQMGVLCRKDANSPWIPAIFEVKGKFYYTLNQVLDNKPNKGVLSGIVELVVAKEKKGSTTYLIVDTKKTKFAPLPADIFKNEETKGLLKDVTEKMGAYRASNQFVAGAQEAPTNTTSSSAPEADDDDLEW